MNTYKQVKHYLSNFQSCERRIKTWEIHRSFLSIIVIATAATIIAENALAMTIYQQGTFSHSFCYFFKLNSMLQRSFHIIDYRKSDFINRQWYFMNVQFSQHTRNFQNIFTHSSFHEWNIFKFVISFIIKNNNKTVYIHKSTTAHYLRL